MGTRLEQQAAESDREIAGLASDSRRVKPGYLFAALSGGRADGRAYAQDAVARGAGALLAGAEAAQALRAEIAVPVLEDENPRRRFALLAARFFGGQPERIAAVTGTNG
jgi:UDP-N-acetylmuramoyl-L-alanyl-D-glutamate--2,6-diaminopimelate ligase